MSWRSAAYVWAYVWVFNYAGWGLIWALTDIPQALWVCIGCGAMAYYHAWRYDNGDQ